MRLQETSAFSTTVASTALVLDEYWRFQAQQGGERTASVLSPLDASLIATVLEYCTEAAVLLDLAGDVTAGESTLLARSHPRLRKLLVPPSPATQESGCETALRFLSEAGPVRPCPVEVLPQRWREALEDGSLEKHLPGSELVTLCGLSSLSPEALVATAAAVLSRAPEGLLLVFPVDRVGDCPHLQALLARFSHRSDCAVRVLREEGEFFGSSQLALVHRRDASLVTEGMERLLASYRGNCSFLDLICARYATAIQEANVDQAALSSRGLNWLASYEREIAELQRQLQEKEQSLQEIVSLPFWARFWRSCKWPIRKARRAVEVFRQAGIREVCKRAVRNCLRVLG
jgi:hypothetical protein